MSQPPTAIGIYPFNVLTPTEILPYDDDTATSISIRLIEKVVLFVKLEFNSNLAKKATLNNEVTFSGIHIGNSIPYIYCSNDGNNILFRISNGSDYVYPSVLGFVNDISSLQSSKQNALNKGLLPEGANLNDYLATNVYTIAGTSYTNNPVNYGVLICFDSGYAYKVQIVIGTNSKLYFRYRSDTGIWGAWQIVTSTTI